MRLNLKNTLAITLLMISMAFMPIGLVAQEGDTQPSAEVTADEGNVTSEGEEVQLSPEKLAELEALPPSKTTTPRISYAYPEDGFTIRIDGILFKEVADFLLNQTVITSNIDMLVEQQIIDVVEGEDGFTLYVKLDPSVLTPGTEFGVVLRDGLKIISVVSDEDKAWWWPGAQPGIGAVRFRGKVYKLVCTSRRCSWRPVFGEPVTIRLDTGVEEPVRTGRDGGYSYLFKNTCTGGFVYLENYLHLYKRHSVWRNCQYTVNDEVADFYIY